MGLIAHVGARIPHSGLQDILHAPYASDGEDIILPLANMVPTTPGGSSISYATPGSALIAKSASGESPVLTYSAAKLASTAYPGKRIVIQADVSAEGAVTGSLGDVARFLSYTSAGTWGMAIAFRWSGSAVRVWGYHFTHNDGTGSSVDLGFTAAIGVTNRYVISVETNGDANLYINNTLAYTAANLQRNGGEYITAWLANTGSGGYVSSIRFHDLVMYLGGNR